MRHLFNLQMIVLSLPRLKGALWSVERATRGACLLEDGLLLDGLIVGGKKEANNGTAGGGRRGEGTGKALRVCKKREKL